MAQLLLAARRRAIPVMLLNARMSERSLAGWRRVPGLARHVLGCFVAVRARAPADAARLQALGAPAVSALGDLKFAAPPLPANQAELERLQALLADRPVWLAASTHPGEEALVLDIHRALARTLSPRLPGLLTILVPRHPERGAEIAALAGDLPLRQRSQGADPPPEGIWLADTLGELGLWYRLARIVFVGRSLLPPGGGQNPLEPARLGCAVAVGPHVGNFLDAVQALADARALTQVADTAALTAWIATMLAHPDQREAAGAAGIAAAARWANLPDETAEALLSLPRPLGEASARAPGEGRCRNPDIRARRGTLTRRFAPASANGRGKTMTPGPPAFWRHGSHTWWPTLLSPISAIAAAITARRIARPGWHAPVPVICCGNVTVGGAGKTTLALDLARRLRARGIAVHILLRGYGGTARGPHRVTPTDPASLVGDEALLLAAVAPTWTGADRAASARAAIAAGAALLLLDDGLQNPTLAKDRSLLVIDGASGFGNGHVLPAGPLREPVAACAARCHAAVLIGADATGAIAHLPPSLPLLRAHLAQGPEIVSLIGKRVLAFAGIARPEKFFDGLAQAGVTVIARRPFPDHHPFTDSELRAVIETATHMQAIPVTTPKDAVRIPPAWRAQIQTVGVGLAWEDAAAIDHLLDQVGARPLSA